MEDRMEAVRQVLRDFHVGEEWDAAVDDDIPPELAGLLGEMLDAYRRADIDWLLRWAKAQQFNSACGSGTTASPRHVPRVGGLTRSCSFSADLVSRSISSR